MISFPQKYFTNFFGSTLTNTLCHFQILKGEILSPSPHLEKQRLAAVHIQYPGCFLSRCPMGQATGEQAPGLPVWGIPKSKRRTLRGEAKARANHCVPKTPVGRVFRHDRRNRKPSQRPSTEGHTASFAILRAGGMMTPFAEGGPGYSRIGGEPRGGPAVLIIRYAIANSLKSQGLYLQAAKRRSDQTGPWDDKERG